MFKLSMSYSDAENFAAFLLFDGSIYLSTIIVLTLAELDAALGPMARNTTIEMEFDPESHHVNVCAAKFGAPVNPGVPS